MRKTNTQKIRGIEVPQRCRIRFLLGDFYRVEGNCASAKSVQTDPGALTKALMAKHPSMIGSYGGLCGVVGTSSMR